MVRAAKRRRSKTLLLALLSAGISLGLLVAALGLVELGLRIAVREAPPVAAPAEPARFLACRHDSTLGWIFPAGSRGEFVSGIYRTHVEANPWGLRSPALDPADTSRVRILVLGDSYAFGWGVREEEAFPRQLETLARARDPGAGIDVINAGIPGYGVYQQCAMLERLTAILRVDVVISTFSLANDPVDDLRILRYAPDRMLEYSAEPRDPRSRVSRLIRHSRLLGLIDRRTQPLQFHVANASGSGIGCARTSLERLAADCDRLGIELLLVTVPRRVEISATGAKAWAARLLTRRAKRMHMRFAREHHLRLLDLGDTLAAVQKGGSAYLPSDTHWDPRGHHAVAEAILDAMPRAWLLARSRRG